MSTNNETKWLVRALVTLAKRHLAEANATPEVQDGNWPAGQEWHELGHTSQHAFMHRAREEAGIPHAEYRDLIEAATMDSDELDAIWQELERPNDRVEGRDAASSRRVPSHDGLCGNGSEVGAGDTAMKGKQ